MTNETDNAGTAEADIVADRTRHLLLWPRQEAWLAGVLSNAPESVWRCVFHFVETLPGGPVTVSPAGHLVVGLPPALWTELERVLADVGMTLRKLDDEPTDTRYGIAPAGGLRSTNGGMPPMTRLGQWLVMDTPQRMVLSSVLGPPELRAALRVKTPPLYRSLPGGVGALFFPREQQCVLDRTVEQLGGRLTLIEGLLIEGSPASAISDREAE
ncbi:MAG TPA: hypothetical protein VFX53_09400 [Pedococcus sp.]|nr:hypothetical protein [Pedococcus sp.]